jgi:hypothetical protein
MSSIFLYSHHDYEQQINTAQSLIARDHIHPIYAMADTFGKPIEQCSLGYTNDSFKVRLDQDKDLIDRFVFPEPGPLLGLCIYMQVHPADLIPEEFREVPAPRSVVQLCKMMSSDKRFPEYDREKANDFLDREIQTCLQLSDQDCT